MCKRLCLWVFAFCSFILCSVIYSRTSCGVKASADTVYRQMTAEEAYSFYGDSISCTYYSTSGYKNVTLVPSSHNYVYFYTSSTTSSEKLLPSWVYSSTIPYVVYYASVSDYSQNPSYLGFDISPNVHFSDCNAVRICAATYWGGSGSSISSSAYSESFFDILSGNTLRYTNTPYILQDGTYSRLGLQRSGGSAFRVLPVPVDFVSDTLGEVSLMRIGFNGGKTDGRDITLYLSAPLVNDSAIGGSGVGSGTTATSGGGSDVDLTETNGLIGRVIQAVQGLGNSILDGLKGLFIPDDDFMDQFSVDMDELAHDHLGGLYEAEQILVDMFDDFDQVTAKNEIYIPAAHIPLAGADLVLGDWHVPLKVAGLPALLYDGIAFIIDFLALMAFLAMCRRKLEIFLVPESEAIKE